MIILYSVDRASQYNPSK